MLQMSGLKWGVWAVAGGGRWQMAGGWAGIKTSV